MKRIVFFTVMFLSGLSLAKTMYVQPGGPGPSPYNSWLTAASNLQDAVNAAVADDTILVAPGSYTAPASKTNVVHITGTAIIPQNSTLTLRAAFPPGVTAGVPVIDGQAANRGILVDGNGDASLPRTLIIDGFHIINGNAGTGHGGAISIPGTGAPWLYLKLLNTTITNNVADRGGGLFEACGPRPFFPTISNCVIRFNRSTSVDRGGGGIYFESATSLGSGYWSIQNSEIADNTADNCGGGVYVRYLQDGTFSIQNVLFADNSALEGGAIYHYGISGGSEQKTLTFWNTTFATNRSTTANGTVQIRYGGGSLRGYNLIFSGNQNADALKRNFTGAVLSPYTIEYSRIDTADTTAFPAPSNITDPPRFENASGGDFHLSLSSPCLHSGTNAAWMATATDLDGNPRQDGAYNEVDMGCYERVFHLGSIISIR